MSLENGTSKIEIPPLWICKHCGKNELVEINKKTLTTVSSCNIRSLPKNWKSSKNEWVKICPACDAYPLGIDWGEDARPIRNKEGQNITIHDLKLNW